MCDSNGNCNCGHVHSHENGGEHSHGHKALICDIHSTLENELKGAGGYVIDSADVVECKKILAENPDDFRAEVALADALVFQMRYREAVALFENVVKSRPENFEVRRKLAARYMSIMQIDKAEKEFLWCDKITDDKLDTLYRLALCAFYKGDYLTAKERFEKCYPYCVGRDEMLIAVIYWDIICRARLNEDIAPALSRYNDDIQCGHHVGYMQAVKLFRYDDLSVIADTEGHGELAVSLYIYGLYNYWLYKGDTASADKTFSELLPLNTYFSSFAYLAAYSDKLRYDKVDKLIKGLRGKKLAVAFSGGTDSAYLLYAGVKADADLGVYYVKSAFQPKFELADANAVCESLNIKMKTISVDVLSDDEITKNPYNRCYYCKRKIFGTIIENAAADGYNVIADGTNASDDLTERPGAKALAEFNVISPLRDAGLTKLDIRELSRRANLITANKPSYSCLATRIKQDEQITAETLSKIEAAESYLFSKGYVDFRVREDGGNAALEINVRQKDKITAEFFEVRAELQKTFTSVTLKKEYRL